MMSQGQNKTLTLSTEVGGGKMKHDRMLKLHGIHPVNCDKLGHDAIHAIQCENGKLYPDREQNLPLSRSKQSALQVALSAPKFSHTALRALQVLQSGPWAPQSREDFQLTLS